MAVGFPRGQADINNRMGANSLDLRAVMDRVQVLKAALDTMTDAELIALPGSPSWVQADVNLLRSVAADQDQLRTIYQGLASLATAKDFRTFAKLTTGFV